MKDPAAYPACGASVAAWKVSDLFEAVKSLIEFP